MVRPLLLVFALTACSSRRPAPPPAAGAAEPPAVIDAACLTPRPLADPVDTAPPDDAQAIDPGRWLYLEPLAAASGEPFADDVPEAWVGVEDSSGGHRFWPLGPVAPGPDDHNELRSVASVDVTGDGIAEHLVEVLSRTSTPPGPDVATEHVLSTRRILWDPAGARVLVDVEVGWGASVVAPPVCDDWCIDGTATTEAEEALFDCDTCVDASDEGHQEVTLDGDVLVVSDPVRLSGEHSLDAVCPAGRFVWSEPGWIR